MATAPLLQSHVPGFSCRRGKVRDVYDLGDKLVIVATDRISAFDWVLPTGIPDKGRVLTQLTLFWLEYLHVPNQKEYRQACKVCGVALLPGLQESQQLPQPIFTPATKEESGHDMNISFEEMTEITGRPLADQLLSGSLGVYQKAAEYTRGRGIIIADTKFEWGKLPDGELILIDEVLTPDSSRFWPKDQYRPGGNPPSFDKQFVRDWLETTGWDKNSSPPPVPDDVVSKTREKYLEAYERLTGKKLPGN